MLVERTHYKLAFEPEHLADMHVTVASMSVRETWAYNDKLDEAGTDAMARYRIMVNTVAPLIVEWNLEKAPGEPWPLTLDGVLDLPDEWINAITMGWIKAVNGTYGPLGQAADPELDEEDDPLASLPVETLAG